MRVASPIDATLRRWQSEGRITAHVYHTLMSRVPDDVQTEGDLRRMLDTGELERIPYIGERTVAALRKAFGE